MRRDRGASRADTERVYEILKKEASNLTRLRHPAILEVVEPVTESRSSIAFATEPLHASLHNLLGNTDGFDGPTPKEITGFELDDLEIQKGLLQVGKGLQFLNHDAKVVHRNLVPEAIFVNAKGDWKIGGLGFSVFLNNPDRPTESFDDFNDYMPDYCQMNLDYAAPEFVLDNDISVTNDAFALGCLAYTVHNKGKSLLETFNNLRKYQRMVEGLSSITYENIPYHLQEVLRYLIVREPSRRMTTVEFQSSKYFDNILVSTMKYLESFPEKSKEEKSQFMKGLSRVLGQFPDRVLTRKILPSLLEELKDHSLLPFTLPNIFSITEKLTQQEFCEKVLPSLKPIFTIRDPPQNMIVLLEKLDVFQKKTPRETFRDDVMPMIYAALETPVPVVQEKALRIIPVLAESLDYTTVKNSLFPRVQSLFVTTTVLSVKVSTLICFHAMIKVIDKFTMQEKLVPLLKGIKTKEPAVMLVTLAVYDEMGKHLDKEIIATEILPQLWRMSFGPLLTLEQFQKFMKTIRELTTRVEEAHSKHLREVKQLEDQTRRITSEQAAIVSGTPAPANGGFDFESLVSGSKSVPPQAAVSADIFGDMNSNGPSTPNMFPTQAPSPSPLSYSPQPMNQSIPSQPPLYSTSGNSSPSYQGHLSPTSFSSMPLMQNSMQSSMHTTMQPMNSISYNQTSISMSSNSNVNQAPKPVIDWSVNNKIPALQPPSSGNSFSQGYGKPAISPQTTPTPNYSAMQNLSLNSSSGMLQPQQSPARSNNLLQPMAPMGSSSNMRSNTIKSSTNKKSSDLDLFDPLG
ncbi:Protein kinase domain-containing protein ppk32 [Umbelopsis sp. WA50703]